MVKGQQFFSKKALLFQIEKSFIQRDSLIEKQRRIINILQKQQININQMSQVISHEYQLPHSIVSTLPNSIKTRQKSPQHLKQSLIQKIQNILYKNDSLQVSLDQLQNTIFDLRKLVELTGNQNDEVNQHLHKQVVQLQNKKDSLEKALKNVHQEGNHMQKCMLFWKEFL